MNRTVGMILAGGVGSRLGVLSQHRAKPAVPFGGIYRIIDFTISNAINSGLNFLGILTQYKPHSLMTHLQNGAAWGLSGRTKMLKILPPSTGHKDSDWYRGTADAVRQNMQFINNFENCDTVLILSGDHIYHMDYSQLVEYHRQKEADVTIAAMTVPMEDAKEFGIAEVDAQGRVIGWEEKPEKPRSNLASMGIYVFSLAYLEKVFSETKDNDFGKNIIPHAMESANTFIFPFSGYWRDVGTIKAYWQTNMDILDPNQPIDPEEWQIYTTVNEGARIGDRPPTFIGENSNIENSLISQGCVIEGQVINSVLSPGVWVQKGAVLQDCVLMNNCEIGEGAQLKRVIIDKEVQIGSDASIGMSSDTRQNATHPGLLQDGLTVIGKNAFIPDRCRIGQHCIIDSGVVIEQRSSKTVESGTTLLQNGKAATVL
ncbi:MAG: glucose-1-phosphate adenylyltransferase subunit GlgD [Deferribacteres bacterium]|nr:glucose-1-phosphate adenylyltransferase subunit GlgD [candidate division KSB1 bacterium]MCB9502828.1 glucose-1-phosphate adenylyltransferase subunit GlgD [Deferribacteres bacterium]